MFNNIYKGRRVLVLGHTGFKGAWLVQWLQMLGAEVAGYALNPIGKDSLFDSISIKEQIRDERGDVRDLEKLKAVFLDFRPQIVFHLAARAIVKNCIENPIEAFDVNVQGTIHVLEAIRSTPDIEAVVIVTSDKCYENVEWEFGYRETDALGGKDPYSASKACAEIATSAYMRTYFNSMPVQIATARAGNVIGGGDWAEYRIVPDCIRAWIANQEVFLRNPGATRPWQHVLEPLSGYLGLAAHLCMHKPGAHGTAFNFGPESTTIQSVGVLVQTLAKLWGAGARFKEQQEQQSHEAGLLRLNCDRALLRLQWRATLDFHETINFTGKWYSHFQNNQPDKQALQQYTVKQIEEYCKLANDRTVAWASNAGGS